MNHLAPNGGDFLRPRLEAALARAGATHEWPDVVDRMFDGRAQWWQSDDERGAIVTEVISFPNLKVINYWLAAGALKSCLALVPRIERWAIREGCTRAIGCGRPGFSKLLGPTGVEVVGLAYRKELVP